MMNSIIGDVQNQWVMVYVDDVIVFSKTLEEHLKHLRELFRRLRIHGLFIKPKKCEFATSQAHFLGHIMEAGGI